MPKWSVSLTAITKPFHPWYKIHVAHSNPVGEILSQQGPHSNNTLQITETPSIVEAPPIFGNLSLITFFFPLSAHIATFPFLFLTFAISFCQSSLRTPLKVSLDLFKWDPFKEIQWGSVLTLLHR